jgi:hypothetical protein
MGEFTCRPGAYAHEMCQGTRARDRLVGTRLLERHAGGGASITRLLPP